MYNFLIYLIRYDRDLLDDDDYDALSEGDRAAAEAAKADCASAFAHG